MSRIRVHTRLLILYAAVSAVLLIAVVAFALR
jgi:hypothetical protein